jgi:hypothetical protein
MRINYLGDLHGRTTVKYQIGYKECVVLRNVHPYFRTNLMVGSCQ